jgi:hypothetical protein
VNAAMRRGAAYRRSLGQALEGTRPPQKRAYYHGDRCCAIGGYGLLRRVCCPSVFPRTGEPSEQKGASTMLALHRARPITTRRRQRLWISSNPASAARPARSFTLSPSRKCIATRPEESYAIATLPAARLRVQSAHAIHSALPYCLWLYSWNVDERLPALLPRVADVSDTSREPKLSLSF